MDVEEPASFQAQHDEHVEQPEGGGRHHREVDDNGFPKMIPTITQHLRSARIA
jgi:hypothetical protein